MRILSIALLLSLLFLGGCTSKPDLDIDERVTESLADALSDWAWSVRDGDDAEIRAFLADRFESTPWPGLDIVKEDEGLYSQTELQIAAKTTGKPEDWLVDLEEMMASLQSVEDVQIKLLDSELINRSELKFEWSLKLIGLGPQGERVWVQLKGTGNAIQAGGKWKLTEWVAIDGKQLVSHRHIFSEVSAAAGLRIPYIGNGRVETSGHPGACTGDLNNDGWLDIVSSDFSGISCYLNQGDGTFQNEGSRLIPTTSGERFQQAPLLVDIDNDGDLDLFLSGKKYDPTRKIWVNCGALLQSLFMETGKLKFKDVTGRLGEAAHRLGGYSVASADLNGDTLPDFFVANWQDYQSKPLLYLSTGASEFGNDTNGASNLLFLSKADGSYEEKAADWGVAGSDWSFVGAFGDLDGDGDQDLLVSNDYGPNRFYLNQGDKFEEVGEARGASRGGFGMGLSLADFDNDGILDVHSTNMSSVQSNRIAAKIERGVPVSRKLMDDWKDRLGANQGNRLLKNRGDGHFEDVTASHGPFLGGWGFGGGFIDINNDGFLDLYAPNGRVSGQNAHDT